MRSLALVGVVFGVLVGVLVGVLGAGCAHGVAPQKPAPVELTYWFDYSCSRCVQFEPTLHELEAKYGTRLRVGYKHYPFPKHPHARGAALAAVAAHRQGKFVEMHQQLLAISPPPADISEAHLNAVLAQARAAHDPGLIEKQLFSEPAAFSMGDLEKCARNIGLDLRQFHADLADPATARVVDADVAEGDRADIQVLPTIVIDGKRYDGELQVGPISAVISEAADAKRTR
jgi:predicted DsbA family dithiol-disulfide isomerase